MVVLVVCWLEDIEERLWVVVVSVVVLERKAWRLAREDLILWEGGRVRV